MKMAEGVGRDVTIPIPYWDIGIGIVTSLPTPSAIFIPIS